LLGTSAKISVVVIVQLAEFPRQENLFPTSDVQTFFSMYQTRDFFGMRRWLRALQIGHCEPLMSRFNLSAAFR